MPRPLQVKGGRQAISAAVNYNSGDKGLAERVWEERSPLRNPLQLKRRSERCSYRMLKCVGENFSRPSGTCRVFGPFPVLKRRAILRRPSGAVSSRALFHSVARKRVLTHTLKRCVTHDRG